jgi:hypothetical protein
MKNMLLIAVNLLIIVNLVMAQKEELENHLFNLPDVIFEKIATPDSFEMAYEIKVRQPLDHFYPSKGYFYQKVYLSHLGFDRPTVVLTAGYSLKKNRILEITELLDANQLAVEHRFFGESMPDSMDYNYLNLRQVTADLHHINQLFKQIYKGKWISSGISKGGVTTIFYRYFYPNDIDVSVPYVAPVNKEREDKRIYTFLDTIGTDECRGKIKSFQTRLLANREKVLTYLKFYKMGAELEFNYLTFDEAYEYAVMEYPFAFWQWGDSCQNIPDDTTSLEEAVEYFLTTKPLKLFSDEDIENYGSHYYQSAAEMGYYGYETYKFKDLIKSLPTDTNPMATFVPESLEVSFDGSLLKNVHEWLNRQGNRFIYIYGAIDTWSACAVEPSDKVDSIWFFLEGKDHGEARIKNMTADERQRLVTTLEKWLSIKID